MKRRVSKNIIILFFWTLVLFFSQPSLHAAADVKALETAFVELKGNNHSGLLGVRQKLENIADKLGELKTKLAAIIPSAGKAGVPVAPPPPPGAGPNIHLTKNELLKNRLRKFLLNLNSSAPATPPPTGVPAAPSLPGAGPKMSLQEKEAIENELKKILSHLDETPSSSAPATPPLPGAGPEIPLTKEEKMLEDMFKGKWGVLLSSLSKEPETTPTNAPIAPPPPPGAPLAPGAPPTVIINADGVPIPNAGVPPASLNVVQIPTQAAFNKSINTYELYNKTLTGFLKIPDKSSPTYEEAFNLVINTQLISAGSNIDDSTVTQTRIKRFFLLETALFLTGNYELAKKYHPIALKAHEELCKTLHTILTNQPKGAK